MAGLAGFVVGPSQGAVWLMNQASRLTGQEIHVEQLAGSLLTKLSAGRVIYRDQELELNAENVELRILPVDLLRGVVNVERLDADILEISTGDFLGRRRVRIVHG